MRIVQLYMGTQIMALSATSGSTVMVYQEVWADTSIQPNNLHIWRGEFPGLRYREIETIEEGELIK